MPHAQMPVCLIPMKEILCANPKCGLKIKNSIDALEKMVFDVGVPAKWLHRIPYVCPACKHLEFGYVPSNEVQADPDEQPLTSGKTQYMVILKCDEKDCPHEIRALATLKRHISFPEATEQISEWTDGGATCPLDHRPRHPFNMRVLAELACI
jgi:hypothetical protein